MKWTNVLDKPHERAMDKKSRAKNKLGARQIGQTFDRTKPKVDQM
jgi:hypothetical protein